MATISYTGISSLDLYTADADGSFDWAAPDPAVHSFVNELERGVGTYLYGRRMYEVMAVWETLELGPDLSEPEREYARIWRAADKVVYSTTLDRITTSRTRLERELDLDAVARMKRELPGEIGLGGPTLSAPIVRAGLVDDFHLFLHPVIVGGGTPHLPTGFRQQLEFVESRSFASGVQYLRYRAAR